MRTDTRLTVMRIPGDAMIKFECCMIDEETNDRWLYRWNPNRDFARDRVRYGCDTRLLIVWRTKFHDILCKRYSNFVNEWQHMSNRRDILRYSEIIVIISENRPTMILYYLLYKTFIIFTYSLLLFFIFTYSLYLLYFVRVLKLDLYSCTY